MKFVCFFLFCGFFKDFCGDASVFFGCFHDLGRFSGIGLFGFPNRHIVFKTHRT